MLLLIELAENCHRDMMILAAKHQADADRAARKAARLNTKRLGCKGNWKLPRIAYEFIRSNRRAK